MNGFDSAQAAYDSALPPSYYATPYTCAITGESNEDCPDHDGDCPEEEECDTCSSIRCRCDDDYDRARDAEWDDRTDYNDDY